MSKTKLVIIIAVVAIAIVLCGIIDVMSSQNKAIRLEEQIGVAQSNIGVQEKRRTDLLPNLADCVKQYDKHEYETLMDVVKARGSSGDNISNEVQTIINAVIEKYPELKSNDNYKQLMNELSITENLISEYRNNYNFQVKNYRAFVKGFPTRIFLNITGYEVVDYAYLEYNTSPDAPTNLFN